MQTQPPQFMMLSKSEQSFLFKRIEKSMRKWKRKQLKKSKHRQFDFTQFNLGTKTD
ncbi:MAG TPA: hypothetical protein VE978_10740 [Chitinophagales bacterium]|nr:hypothetical protein [Chitinophagales bacterium]